MFTKSLAFLKTQPDEKDVIGNINGIVHSHDDNIDKI